MPIFKVIFFLKLKDFSQTSQSPQELALVPKFWENLAAESKVRSYGEGEENFDKSDATSDTDRNTVHASTPETKPESRTFKGIYR